MNNVLKGLAVIVACVLFFLASITAIRSIGEKRNAGDFIPPEMLEEENRKTETEAADDSDEEVLEEEETAKGDSASEGEETNMQDISKDFDKELVSFLEEAGYKNENYMVSPASLRAVLTLAVAGADSDTKTSLIKAMGFEDEEEMNKWYEKVATAPEPMGALITYKLLNSAWHNADFSGNFSDDYKGKIKDKYGAEANDVSSDKITDAVNSWVNEGTEGLIPEISDDLSATDLVLVNTLYLKSAWISTFEEAITEEGEFTAFDGSTVMKDFMEQSSHFGYYEDSDCKLVVLPMDGGVSAAFVIGNTDDICNKINKASNEKVRVRIPKFEAESTFDKKEMADFIKSRGAGIAFSPDADFSVMSDNAELYVSDIVQKTKIKVDEGGIEASAATAVAVLGALPGMPEEPKEFIADEPFKYFIITDTDDPEILFCGQIVK